MPPVAHAANEKSATPRPAKRGRGRISSKGQDPASLVNTRALILDSALQVFSERGFAGASTREIASRAGVTHTMITYYFATKDDLWKAAVDFLFERLSREVRLEGVLLDDSDKSLLAAAREGVRNYVRYCARHPVHHRLMIQESVSDTPRLQWAIETHIAGNHLPGIELFKVLIARKLVPQVEPLTLLYMVVGASQLIYTLSPEVKAIWHIDPQSAPMIEQHVDAMCRIFFPDKNS